VLTERKYCLDAAAGASVKKDSCEILSLALKPFRHASYRSASSAAPPKIGRLLSDARHGSSDPQVTRTFTHACYAQC